MTSKPLIVSLLRMRSNLLRFAVLLLVLVTLWILLVSPRQSGNEGGLDHSEASKGEDPAREEFLLALKRYGELHNDMLDGKRPGKYLTFRYAGSGWADRVRAFMGIATLAFMTDRAFLFNHNMPDMNISAMYDQSPVRWYQEVPDEPLLLDLEVLEDGIPYLEE